MRRALLLVASWGLSCAPEARPPAQAWAVPALLQAAHDGRRVAGIDAALLTVPAGATMPFRGPPAEPSAPDPTERDALAICPAFQDATPAAYFVTEVWDAHPLPWVQPEYVVRTSAPAALARVFSVDTRSTFYSPFWEELIVSVPDDADAGRYTSSQAVLSASKIVRRARLVLYPIVTDDGVDVGPARPYSLQPVTTLAPVNKAWVDGAQVSYLQIITERFSMHAGVPDETILYDLVVSADTEPLAVPSVLSSTAKTQALSRRVRAYLPAVARAFIPSGWDSLKDELAARGFPASDVGSPDIDPAVARAYALRVASDPSCFGKPAAFPQGCKWLDSEAALRADRRLTFEPTSTLLTVVQVDLKAP